MEVSPTAVHDTLARLRRDGFDEVEVYAKSGRSRRIAVGAEGATTGFHREAGWAVRASGGRSSFAASGTGTPDPLGPWPDPDGEPFRLPDPVDSPAWSEPDDLDSSLAGEVEGLRLLDSLGTELAGELPGARLASAVLEDGASEHVLANGRGIAVRWRSRLAALRAEAILPRSGRSGPAVAGLYLAEREARRFSPKVLARRLADRLAVAGAGAGKEAGEAGASQRDRAEMLLDPAVATRLLAGLLPLWVGPDAGAAAQALRDRGGRLASPAVTLIDDGRLRGGVASAPCDGEGVATRAVTLVDGGHFRQPLLAWNQLRGTAGGPAGRALAALASGVVASGCARRPSWRDLPQPGPTHLFLRPEADVGVGALLAEVTRGYYLLDADGAGSFDLEADRFRLPVRGFAVEAGRAVAPLPGAVLGGGIGALLRGVQAVGRDLTFLPLGGMIGSPSLLVTGLELTFPH